MIVTFCGHSELNDESNVRQWLETTIQTLIDQGAKTFYLGGYGAFDHMVARVLTDFKKQYPWIERTLVLAYLNKPFEKTLYDNTYYPALESVPKRFAILKRNEKMIEEADVVVAYVLYSWGGAAKTLEHAKRKKKVIVRYPESAETHTT